MAGAERGKSGSKGVAQHFWEAVEGRYLVLSALLLWGPRSSALGLGISSLAGRRHKAGREEQVHVREVSQDRVGGAKASLGIWSDASGTLPGEKGSGLCWGFVGRKRGGRL